MHSTDIGMGKDNILILSWSLILTRMKNLHRNAVLSLLN